MRRIFLVTLLSAALAGCMISPRVTPAPAAGASVIIEPGEPWREAAKPADAQRIDALVSIWTRTVSRMPARAAKDMAAEGPLLDGGSGLDHPEPSPGSYSCRIVRLEPSRRAGSLRSFPANFCYIKGEEDKTLSLTKQTGSDLPAGRLYPAGDKRYVFLGARQRKVGDNSLAYGADAEQDVAGVVERVGPFRWRMIAPARDGRSIDVYELTPVPTEQQPG